MITFNQALMTIRNKILRMLLCGAMPLLMTEPLLARDTYNFNPGWLLKVGDESGAEKTRGMTGTGKK